MDTLLPVSFFIFIYLNMHGIKHLLLESRERIQKNGRDLGILIIVISHMKLFLKMTMQLREKKKKSFIFPGSRGLKEKHEMFVVKIPVKIHFPCLHTNGN